jgi:hypothetical protein
MLLSLSELPGGLRSSDEKDLTVAAFQAAISNAFIPRALPWAIAILDLGSNGRMGKNYASAQRAGSATAQGNALGINALRFGSLKDCNCQTFFIRRPCLEVTQECCAEPSTPGKKDVVAT